MKSSSLKPRYHVLLPTLLCSSFLVACVSEKTTQTTGSDNQNQMSESQPVAVALSATHMSEVSVQARSKESEFSIEDTGENLEISISYTDVVSASHSQIFLNTDNNTSTGFGFHQEAWGVIGADYMIQDEYLYLALSNNADWDWQPVARVGNYSHSSNQINMTVSKNLIGNPCGSIHAGTMGRNNAWGVEVMYPVAKTLTQISIAGCGSDSAAPVMTLNGDAQITLTQGSAFTDPGATAIDDVDGDISSQVQTSGSVDTSTVGTYTLNYSAMDSSGNSANSISRTVTIVSAATTLPPVGLSGDWSTLINKQSLNVGFDTNLTIEGAQELSSDDIYLMLTKRFAPSIGHIQIYLDTDNNPATGYQAWSGVSTSAESGAEYMIEDGQLFKYTGTGIGWSWSNEPIQTPYAYTESSATGVNVSEMKSIFSSSLLSGSEVGILVMWMNADWTNQNIFSPSAVYSR